MPNIGTIVDQRNFVETLIISIINTIILTGFFNVLNFFLSVDNFYVKLNKLIKTQN